MEYEDTPHFLAKMMQNIYSIPILKGKNVLLIRCAGEKNGWTKASIKEMYRRLMMQPNYNYSSLLMMAWQLQTTEIELLMEIVVVWNHTKAPY